MISSSKTQLSGSALDTSTAPLIRGKQ